MIRSLAKKLPWPIQHQIKQMYYRHQINNGTFVSPEIEYSKLGQLIKNDDWIVDIGANVGHYTRKFSELAPNGRVIAFEPHPITFSHLASNVADLKNVTLYNTAFSSKFGLVGFTVPDNNFYQASISADGEYNVISASPSILGFDERIAFIKIDAEGHEPTIIESLTELINKDKPILMIELNTKFLKEWSKLNGYSFVDFENSHNHILIPNIN